MYWKLVGLCVLFIQMEIPIIQLDLSVQAADLGNHQRVQIVIDYIPTILNINYNIYWSRGDNSVGKALAAKPGWPEFKPWDPCGRREDPLSCSLNSTLCWSICTSHPK